MLKHIVMWKLKDFAEGNSKQENAILIKARLESLKTIITELKELQIGINCLNPDTNYDLVLSSTFTDTAALKSYANHPEHLSVAEFVGKVCLDRKAVDFEF